MTTLIAVYDSEGCRGRCDARCYEAKHPECDCICGGKNHGAGEKQAITNTRELAEVWLHEYAKREGLKDYTSELGNLVLQPSLWE